MTGIMRILKSEWRKLRRPTLLFGALGAAVFFSGLFTSLLFILVDSAEGNSRRGQMISRATLALPQGVTIGFASVAGFLGVIALCVFAAQTAQEYTYSTLRNLLVRQPSRMKILLGKLAAMKIFTLIMVLLSAIVSISAAVIFAEKKSVSTLLWFTGAGQSAIIHTLINVFISVLGYGIIGMVLGLLLRSPISSISIGVLWLLIVENLLGAVKASTLRWLPGSQLQTIASGGTREISYTHAMTVGGAYVLIGGVIASILFVRRDVAN